MGGEQLANYYYVAGLCRHRLSKGVGGHESYCW